MKSRDFFILSGVCAVVVWLGANGFSNMWRNNINKNITIHLYRATIAQTPTEIQSQLINLKYAMKIHNMTTGSIAIDSDDEYPPNQMNILYNDLLTNLIQQANRINTLNPESSAYYLSLQMLRNDIDRIDINIFWKYKRRHAFALISLAYLISALWVIVCGLSLGIAYFYKGVCTIISE